MHHQSYWENINYTKYKETKFEIFLNMEDNTAKYYNSFLKYRYSFFTFKFRPVIIKEEV